MPGPYWNNNWLFLNSFRWDWAAGFLFPLALWSLVWTGFALWYAARRGEKWWFILFLIVHTAGILELIYLLFVVRAFSKTTSRKSRRS